MDLWDIDHASDWIVELERLDGYFKLKCSFSEFTLI